MYHNFMKKKFLNIEISATQQRALKCVAAQRGLSIRRLVLPAIDQLVASPIGDPPHPEAPSEPSPTRRH